MSTSDHHELSSSSSSSSKSPVAAQLDKKSNENSRFETTTSSPRLVSSDGKITSSPLSSNLCQAHPASADSVSSATTSSSSICKQFSPLQPASGQPQYATELIVDEGQPAAVPKEVKKSLYRIFAQIEKEFDQLYQENAFLRQQLFLLNNHRLVKSEETNLASNNTSNPYSSTSTLVAPISSLTGTTITNNGLSSVADERKCAEKSNPAPESTSCSSSSSISNPKSATKNVNFSSLYTNEKDIFDKSLSPKSLTAIFNNESRFKLGNQKIPQLTSSLTSSAVFLKGTGANDIPTPQSTKSALVSSKSRINNLSFPKFKPNAREFIIQSIKNTSAQIANHSKLNTNSSGALCNPKLETNVMEAHKDGVWDVSCTPMSGGHVLVGTGSADATARLWNFSQNHHQPPRSCLTCTQEYSGHAGSVNSIRFHPRFLSHATNLVLTASGDCQAHIWQFVPETFNGDQPCVIRSPMKRFETHSDACIAAEWFPDGEQLATASWDRTANVFNVETGKSLCVLQHDDHLTNVTSHPSQKIILTSSKDTTFKIWDFRDPICSVQIYQGHTRSVNSAIFVNDDKIATASDDQHLKLWDLREMRSPVFSVNVNSGINRICSIAPNSSVSTACICVPLDNRDIKIYNLSGERVLRFPRNSRSLLGHRRLVTSVASSGTILFSASFDKSINCWSFEHNHAKQHSLSSRLLNKENANENLLNEIFSSVLQPCQTATSSASEFSLHTGHVTSTPPPPPGTPPLSLIVNSNKSSASQSGKIPNQNTLAKLTEKMKI